MVQDLVHREIFLQYFGVYDADVQVACKVEARFEEKAAERFLLPFVRYDDGILGLFCVAAFYQTGYRDEFAVPLLDGFCDNRYFFIGIYVAETPGIFGCGAEG